MDFAADLGDHVSVSGDVGKADPGHQAGATLRQVMNIAAAGTVARAGIDDTTKSREPDFVVRDAVAAADFSAGEPRIAAGIVDPNRHPVRITQWLPR